MFLFRKKKGRITLPQSDVHNHLLPGVDDGFRDESQSLNAIEKLMEAGVTRLVLTPHMNPDVYPNNSETSIKEKYNHFKSVIPREWNITTELAAEYMIVNDFENRAYDPNLLTYSDGKSILVEMSYFYRSQNLEQTIFELSMAGKKPILAHPERYIYMVESLEDFEKLQDMGCRLQLNWMSLTGAYGFESMKILKHLLTHDMYSFVCTDLHSEHQLEHLQTVEIDASLLEHVERIKEKMNGAGF